MVRIVAHDLHRKIPSMIEHWAELYTATARACSVSQYLIYAQRFVPCVTGAIALALAKALTLALALALAVTLAQAIALH